MSARLTAEMRRWRDAAREHDAAYAAGWRAGHEAHRSEHRRLVVLGVVAAIVLLGRRLHLHPLIAAAWGALWLLALWPLVVVGVCIETVHRQHGRWRSWPRTGALVASWAACAGLVYLALTWRSPWPLVGVGALVAAWAVEHGLRVHRAARPSRSAAEADEPF